MRSQLASLREKYEHETTELLNQKEEEMLSQFGNNRPNKNYRCFKLYVCNNNDNRRILGCKYIIYQPHFIINFFSRGERPTRAEVLFNVPVSIGTGAGTVSETMEWQHPGVYSQYFRGLWTELLNYLYSVY